MPNLLNAVRRLSFGALVLAGGCTDTLSGGPVSDLSGTWDLTGSRPGARAETGTLVIARDTFSITLGRASLAYTAPSLRYDDRGSSTPLTADRTPQAVSLGIIPTDIGGNWRFSDPARPESECSLEVGGAAHSFLCTRSVSRWPSALPRPNEDVRYTMTRTSAAESDFGDLGGDWSAGSVSGGPACKLTLSGHRIVGSCPRGISRIDGSFEATFADDVVSGVTNGGIEFAGHRR